MLSSSAGLCAAMLGACSIAEAADEGAARKARSIALLRTHGVSYMQGLPEIETSTEVRLRSTEEIVQRAVCLFAVALAATTNEPEPAHKVLDVWRASASLSPNERKFLSTQPVPEGARTNFSWRFEAAVPLLWALGWLDPLWFPSTPVDQQSLHRFYQAGPGRNPIRLRSIGDILDQADLIYRMHWALVEARLGRPVKVANLDPDVVPERHRALNWLIRYGNDDWDEVTTDT